MVISYKVDGLAVIGLISFNTSKYTSAPIAQAQPETTSAYINEPVAPIIYPVTIGPNMPPQFETVFWMPPNTDVIFRGAISPGRHQMAEPAKASPIYEIQSNIIIIVIESTNPAREIEVAINIPPTKFIFRARLILLVLM